MRAYRRASDLPRLIAAWPDEIADFSEAGSQHLIARIRRALRAERKRGKAGHWSYDLGRHLALLQAYKSETAALADVQGAESPAHASRESETEAAVSGRGRRRSEPARRAGHPVNRPPGAEPDPSPSVARPLGKRSGRSRRDKGPC